VVCGGGGGEGFGGGGFGFAFLFRFVFCFFVFWLIVVAFAMGRLLFFGYWTVFCFSYAALVVVVSNRWCFGSFHV
jgi:hypothetical protein